MSGKIPVKSGSESAAPALDAEQVAAFLQANPGFLNERPELLAELTPPDRSDGDNLLDLQQFMLRRLQAEVKRLSGYQEKLIAASRANMAVQGQIHDAVLALLEARTFEHLIHIVTHDLAQILRLDAVTLCVENGGENAPARVRTSGVHVLAPGSVNGLLGRGRKVRLCANTPGDERMFGPAAGLVQSFAMARLRTGALSPAGLVAFGSRDPDRFHDGQATEMLSFLARALERLIRGWLNLPA